MNAKKPIGLIISLIVIVAVFSSACVKPQEPPAQKESPVLSPPEHPPEPPAPAPVNLSPAKPEEAREALARIYQTAVTLDESHKLIAGDFNGDQSQDIAIVVKPSESAIEDINSEVANWTLGDPTKVVIMKKTGVHPTPAPVRIEKTDTLLAVIHGHGPEGWRNKDAMQTYLLRNAIGSEMKMQSAKDATRMFRGKLDFPRLNGDVIRQTLGGRQSFLYWTGAKYAWCLPISSEDAVARNKQ